MGKQKILFIGLGGIGQRHLRNVYKIKDGEIDVYAIRKRKSSFVLDDKLKIVDDNLDIKYDIKCIDSVEEAANLGIKVAFITNPTNMHLNFLDELIRYEFDVFIEKPVSNSMEGVSEIINMLKHSKSKVFVGFQMRYHPCVKKTKEIIENGEIGQIFSIYASIGESVKLWHPYEDYRNMYACRKDLGGGVVVTQIHEIDYLYYIMGMPDKVYASGGKFSNLEIDVEDCVDTIMTYNRDNFRCNVLLHQDYVQNPPERKCFFIGTKGKIVIDLLESSFSFFNGNGTLVHNEVFDFQRNDMFIEETKDFFSCIENRSKEKIDFLEGVQSLIITDSIYQSIKNNCEIRVKELNEVI